MFARSSGVLCHVTSLPSRFGIGDLGPDAHRFVDYLSEARQAYWQVLPLTPTEPGLANSPYNSSSSYAGNPLLISPEFLKRDGFLIDEDLKDVPGFSAGSVDYVLAGEYKKKIFEKAFDRFDVHDRDFQKFLFDNPWVNDYAFFVSLKNFFSQHAWSQWPQDVRDREEDSLRYFSSRHQRELDYVRFLQYQFFKQWNELKAHARKAGVKIIGDIPIYVSYDSVDVWMNPQFFKLDRDKKQAVVAGVPPDYFSETGQRWGNPVYDWKTLEADGFRWWISRMKHNLDMYDVVRIDHFRGLVQYWEIPASEKTAINGSWQPVPTHKFLDALLKACPGCPLIAEDLGVITDDVRQVMKDYGFPGMKILLFAFDGDPRNAYLPQNYSENAVAYVGTHDNNTARGWMESEMSADHRKHLENLLKRPTSVETVAWDLTKVLFESKANIVLVSLQDLFGLGASHRMNVPGTVDGNWVWRVQDVFVSNVWRNLKELTQKTGREALTLKENRL